MFVSKSDLIYPALGIVVSGGHTAIYDVQSPSKITLLDETLDDAIGEVYDKVGRALGLQYPAGAKIDQLYNPEQAETVEFLKQINYQLLVIRDSNLLFYVISN